MAQTPERLLVAARIVLDRRDAFASTSWHRSSALLARQALEAAIDRFWDDHRIPLQRAPRKQQLICLPWYLDDRRAARHVHHTWANLSSACHHHAYDLAPTAPELRAWLGDVRTALLLLAPSKVRDRSPGAGPATAGPAPS